MINLSPLEEFVTKYLKAIKKSGNIRHMIPFVEKAIALIKIKLGEDCCSDPTTTYSYTRLENDFTRTVRYLIKKMYGPGTDKILHKVIKILGRFLGTCCTESVTITWPAEENVAEISLTFIGQYGQGEFQTDSSGTTPQTLTLPKGPYKITMTYSGALNQFDTIALDSILTMTGTEVTPKSVTSAVVSLESSYTITTT